MIKVFHGFDESTHDAFQAWRKANPDGFNLSEGAKGVFTAHWSQDSRENSFGRGCMHQGGADNSMEQGACLTRAKKVCSDDINELIRWVQEANGTLKRCLHCDTRKFPFPVFDDSRGPAGAV